jgi:hypothetical protein
MRRRTVVTVMLALAVLAGCSRARVPTSLNDVGENLGLRGEVPYFAAVDRVSVRNGARLSARIVGHLELHQMVLRSGVNNGYARIRVPYGSLRGWVDDDKLVGTLPADG